MWSARAAVLAVLAGCIPRDGVDVAGAGPGADAGEPSEGSTRFCSDPPASIVCEDFDGAESLPGWDRDVAPSGKLVVIDTDATSRPRSLEVSLAPNADPSRDANLSRSPTELLDRFELDFQVQLLDEDPMRHGSYAVLRHVESGFAIRLRNDGTVVEQLPTDSVKQTKKTQALDRGRWTAMRLVVDLRTAPSLLVHMAGEPPVSLTLDPAWTKGHVFVRVGIISATVETSALRLRYDDVKMF